MAILFMGYGVQRRRSQTPRPLMSIWNRGVIAGFCASALFGVPFLLLLYGRPSSGLRLSERILEQSAVVLEIGMLGTKTGELIPEPLLPEPSKVSRRESGHIVKPLGELTQCPNTSNVTLPKQRAKPLASVWQPSNRANVQHGPVEEVTVCVFSMLVHMRRAHTERPASLDASLRLSECNVVVIEQSSAGRGLDFVLFCQI